MKKLNRKTFFTIFLLISAFLIVGIVLYNVQNYKREYDNVERNLNKINRMMPEDRSDHIHKEFDNMIRLESIFIGVPGCRFRKRRPGGRGSGQGIHRSVVCHAFFRLVCPQGHLLICTFRGCIVFAGAV